MRGAVPRLSQIRGENTMPRKNKLLVMAIACEETPEAREGLAEMQREHGLLPFSVSLTFDQRWGSWYCGKTFHLFLCPAPQLNSCAGERQLPRGVSLMTGRSVPRSLRNIDHRLL